MGFTDTRCQISHVCGLLLHSGACFRLGPRFRLCVFGVNTEPERSSLPELPDGRFASGRERSKRCRRSKGLGAGFQATLCPLFTL